MVSVATVPIPRFVLFASLIAGSLCTFGERADARPVKIVVIGDNNIKGKGVDLSEAYPAQMERALHARAIDAQVINAGRNGDTAISVLARLSSLVPTDTDVAVVSIGVNDVVYHGVHPDVSRANVREIGQRLRARGIEVVLLPLTPELEAACDAMPRAHLTYIVTAYGKPRSVAGLGNDFARWATEAGLPKRCRLHGLKKGGMRRLAEAGDTTHELMAISGHRTLSEVQRYTADADRKKLADSGMKKRIVNADVSNPAAPPAQTKR
jgi:lysophospholipase L1-like esterase